jgi:hypothetical protein
VSVFSQNRTQPDNATRSQDAVDEARQKSNVPVSRPEQNKTPHDLSAVFTASAADPSSPLFRTQPKDGRNTGFDFYRDPLGADRPAMTFDEIFKKESADKANVMKAQLQLLQRRYDLTPKLDPAMKMARGKPLSVGPTARLPQGMTWEQIGALRPDDIRSRNIFPYRSLPHPLQTNGGHLHDGRALTLEDTVEFFNIVLQLRLNTAEKHDLVAFLRQL